MGYCIDRQTAYEVEDFETASSILKTRTMSAGIIITKIFIQ